MEDWAIHNTTPIDHPFHLHAWPMRIIDDNGLEPAEPTWREVAALTSAHLIGGNPFGPAEGMSHG